jgi:glutathione S-transferase
MYCIDWKLTEFFLIQVINALLKSIHVGRVDNDEAEVITEGLTTFEKELANRSGPFFAGQKPGMLDYMIWPWCERSDVLKMFGRAYILKKDKYQKLVIIDYIISFIYLINVSTFRWTGEKL